MTVTVVTPAGEAVEEDHTAEDYADEDKFKAEAENAAENVFQYLLEELVEGKLRGGRYKAST